MNLTPENVSKIKSFIRHVMRELGLRGKCKIVLSNKPTGLPTAGYYDPETGEIVVAVRNRAIADVMRTISHELVHQRQRQDGVDFPSDDDGLQPYENEANMRAGYLVRMWGRKHQEIYADLSAVSLSEVMFPHTNNRKLIRS